MVGRHRIANVYHFSVMAFIIGLPVAQIILFCWAVGHDPVGLRVAVTNYELQQANLSINECPSYPGCNYSLLSCRYLENLKNRSVVVVSWISFGVPNEVEF